MYIRFRRTALLIFDHLQTSENVCNHCCAMHTEADKCKSRMRSRHLMWSEVVCRTGKKKKTIIFPTIELFRDPLNNSIFQLFKIAGPRKGCVTWRFDGALQASILLWIRKHSIHTNVKKNISEHNSLLIPRVQPLFMVFTTIHWLKRKVNCDSQTQNQTQHQTLTTYI